MQFGPRNAALIAVPSRISTGGQVNLTVTGQLAGGGGRPGGHGPSQYSAIGRYDAGGGVEIDQTAVVVHRAPGSAEPGRADAVRIVAIAAGETPVSDM